MMISIFQPDMIMKVHSIKKTRKKSSTTQDWRKKKKMLIEIMAGSKLGWVEHNPSPISAWNSNTSMTCTHKTRSFQANQNQMMKWLHHALLRLAQNTHSKLFQSALIWSTFCYNIFPLPDKKEKNPNSINNVNVFFSWLESSMKKVSYFCEWTKKKVIYFFTLSWCTCL